MPHQINDENKLIKEEKEKDESKELSAEETNFLSIPKYSSERTGRERKEPLPTKFLKEWNKEIEERGDLNPKN